MAQDAISELPFASVLKRGSGLKHDYLKQGSDLKQGQMQSLSYEQYSFHNLQIKVFFIQNVLHKAMCNP